MIHLAQPAWLLLAALMLVLYLIRPQRTWRYSSVSLLPTSRLSGWPGLVTAGVTCIAIACLLIALARPQQTTIHASEIRNARDIVLTLDLSLSMEGFLPAQEAERRAQRKLDLVQRAALAFSPAV